MAFTVNLYEFKKKTNSTMRPSGSGYAMSCEAHDPIDIMAPVMVFNTLAPFPYNYMYVAVWDRYYWIDNWTHDEGLWYAHCSIDPLASWRISIGNMTEYVLRSADEYTPEVVDTTYPLTATVETDRIRLIGWNVAANPSGWYIVGVVGGNGLTEFYVMNSLQGFGAAMFGDTMWNNVVADDPALAETNIPNFMKAQFNPLQYVVSCMWFPFEPQHSLNTFPVKFGYFDSGFSAYKAATATYQILSGNIPIPNHPQSSRGTYLNLAPFTRLRISAFPWGEIDLDTTKFANKTKINFTGYLDPITGSTKLEISNGVGDVITTLIGQIGVTVQLSQVLKDNLATVTGGMSAVAGAASMFTGNIAGGLATVVSGIGNAVAAQYPDVSTTGTNGAKVAVAPSNISLIVTHQHIVEEDKPNHGRPLCKRRKLSSLPGYLLISDPDVEIPATKAEIDAIKQFMTTGFFYE